MIYKRTKLIKAQINGDSGHGVRLASTSVDKVYFCADFTWLRDKFSGDR